MTAPGYCHRTNADRHFTLITQCRREVAVRTGEQTPRGIKEKRQAREGAVASWKDLDAFKNPEWEIQS
ncbi:hypothetical protein SAMN06297251_102112 [Fulvimarina manganoxydans]|uniref:Uncharacterized protein n=1 Tax=Fulvimarina manganoxydans TaxID=937218 RepID=A0A1W1Z413_9HYPH|nr:hypothetical protein [Fulvimarina manganoxydans]SMC42698.1 hypothetical protein SAMN06297251_102112 [Fulvimarina manganoxydans]